MNTNLLNTGTDISRAWFLRTVLAHLAPLSDAILGSEGARGYARRMALAVADAVETHYPALGIRATPLTPHEFAGFLLDFKEHLGGVFVVEVDEENALTLIAEQCPWADVMPHVPGLCTLLASVYGWLAARHFGYAKIVHERSPHATPDARCHMRLYIHPSAEAQACVGEEFVHASPSESAPYDCRDTVDTVLGNPEAFMRCQLAATQRLEQALEKEHAAHEELLAAARVKEEFLANVSHELRTPITAMQGYLDLMAQGVLGDLNAEQALAVDVTRRNLERLSRMVRDLLDYAALARGECRLATESVEMAEVLAHSLLRADEVARERCITLVAAYHAPVARVQGDREKLTQIVTHLLENAVKFSEPGRTVTLSASTGDCRVCLEVCDAGIGMTPEQLHHVFTPFVQGDTGLTRRFGGLGVGLSLIRNLVQIHGGDIAIASTPGHGTTVRVELPLAA